MHGHKSSFQHRQELIREAVLVFFTREKCTRFQKHLAVRVRRRRRVQDALDKYFNVMRGREREKERTQKFDTRPCLSCELCVSVSQRNDCASHCNRRTIAGSFIAPDTNSSIDNL